MGWFEDQVKQRQQLDEQTFEDSFMSLAGLRVKKGKEQDKRVVRENYAISQILSYFSHQMGDLPSRITDFMGKVHYAIHPYEISYHKVDLNEQLFEDSDSPILAFTKKRHTPVVFLPWGRKGYYYVNYKTGKKTKVNPWILSKLDTEVYLFYRPLPGRKVSLMEYIGYLRQSSRPLDFALLVLFTIAIAGVGLLLPYLTKLLTGEVAQGADYNRFIAISIYVVSAATGSLILKSFQGFISSRINIRREKSIRAATMMRVLSFPPSFFKKYNTGELNARFNAVPALASTITNGVFVGLASSAMSLAHLFQMGSFAPALIVPVILILFASTGFTIFVAVLQKSYTRKVLELSSKEAGVTYEMINGVQKIRLAGSEKRVFAKWASTYSRSARAKYRPPVILRLASALTFLISLIGSIVLYSVAMENGIDASSYMAFVASYGILTAAFASLGQVVSVASSIQPLYEMARPILTGEPENATVKPAIETVKGNIRMDNVSFRYGENGPLILDKLSIDIKEGEYVAIVGPTGCGKSTFVRLLLGFESPCEGDIYFDGTNIKDIDITSLRKHIGTVMQNGHLFHADILSNIIISAPNLGEKEAWDAAEIADIANDIREMPMGMKTVISEGQGGISGGQKQRIMIARAIVHKPKILIFDEATSALDNKTQRAISDSIDQLNCTRIVIAHRLSTIKNADRILMLERGRIIESGDYETLIQKNGRFAELVERQRLYH